jgi:hypothetical protein
MATVTTVKTKDFQQAEGTPLVDDGKGYWKGGTECSCFTNCCICCAVCWCHPITTGQIYERSVVKGLLQKLPLLGCLSIAIFLYFAEIFEYVVSVIYQSTSSHSAGEWWKPDWYSNVTSSEASKPLLHLVSEPALKLYMLSTPSDNSAYSGLSYVAQGVSLAASLCICLIVCTVRQNIRKRDSIPTGGCGGCEDCCCACCCNPCTQCMILRHELHGYKPGTNEQYELCSKTASAVPPV